MNIINFFHAVSDIISIIYNVIKNNVLRKLIISYKQYTESYRLILLLIAKMLLLHHPLLLYGRASEAHTRYKQ